MSPVKSFCNTYYIGNPANPVFHPMASENPNYLVTNSASGIPATNVPATQTSAFSIATGSREQSITPSLSQSPSSTVFSFTLGALSQPISNLVRTNVPISSQATYSPPSISYSSSFQSTSSLSSVSNVQPSAITSLGSFSGDGIFWGQLFCNI